MGQPRSTSHRTIKDDPRGSLSAALSSHVDCGARLLRAGGLIGGRVEFEDWHAERRCWRLEAARTVEADFEPEAICEFLLITGKDVRGADWEQSLAAELRGLRNGVELLELLCGTLSLHEPRSVRPALELGAHAR
jgi:hypothetical protein